MSRPRLFVYLLWEQLGRDHVLIRASGLAYSSLLATVPLVAVLFAIFSVVDAFDGLEVTVRRFLFSQFLPTRRDEIVGYIDRFADNAGQLGFVGFLFLLATALLLLDAIETTFNEVWNVRRRRRLVAKLTAFSSVLIFGTLFLGASLTVSSRLFTLLSAAPPMRATSFFTRLADASLPFLLAVAGFLVLYLAVPYTRVRWRSAALGAAVGGGLWEVAKSVFAATVGKAVSYSTIYGSLAAFPIFLVWLYVTWILVLFGLDVAYTHQHFETLARERERRGGPRTAPVVVALKLFAEVARRSHRGEEPPTSDDLSRSCLEPLERIEWTIDRLLEADLLRTVELDDDHGGFAPAKRLDRIHLVDVAAVFLTGLTESGDDPVDRRLATAAAAFFDGGRRALGDATFADLVGGKEPRPDLENDGTDDSDGDLGRRSGRRSGPHPAG